MKIGMLELVVIFVVALLVLGPEKMPYYTKKFAQALGQLKGYTNKLAEDIKENIVDPLEETTAPLKDAVEPLTSLKNDIEQPFKEVQKSISDIGKTKPTQPTGEAKESDPTVMAEVVETTEAAATLEEAPAEEVEEMKKESKEEM